MNEFPKAQKVKKRRLSPVWLTPGLAVLITAWLILNGYINSGKEIRVQFDSGAGIIAGKTPLQYRGLNIGKVTGFELAESLDKVNVVIKLDKQASAIAKEGMMFWVVKPRLSIDRITGLETIISGAYIEIRPPTYDQKALDSLNEQDFFIGYAEQPDLQAADGAVFVNLTADGEMTLYKGMSVFHKGVEAGNIHDIEYDENAGRQKLTITIDAKYGKYINSGTRFWNAGGIDIKLGSGGLSFRSAPLTAIFQGGIAFESDIQTEQPAPEPDYPLFTDYDSTVLSTAKTILHMPESYGFTAGVTPVIYKGVKAGVVSAITMSPDNKTVNAEIRIIRQYKDLLRTGSRFVVRKTEISANGIQNLSSVITGAFPELIAGTGEPSNEFTIHDGPLADVPEGSVDIKLYAEEKYELDTGSGLYFKGVKAGIIKGCRLEGDKVVFDAAVYADYAQLLTRGLYVWIPEALSVDIAGSGVDIRTVGIRRMIDGGVSLGYFSETPDKRPSGNNTFTLYKSEDSAKEAFIIANGIEKIYLTAQDASGIEKGAPVLYKGIKVGELGNSYLTDSGVRITAMIYSRYKNLVSGGTYFWKPGNVAVNLHGEDLQAEIPSFRNLLNGGVAFENNASESFRDTRVLFDSKLSAQQAVKTADAGKVIRLISKGADFPPEGAGVYFRGAKAGEIAASGYDQTADSSYASIIIYKGFENTITPTVRFWKNGRMEITPTGDSVQIDIDPLRGYISGAVSYDKFAKAEGTGILYTDRDAAAEKDYTKAEVILPSSYSFRAQAPVNINGIKVGYIKSLSNLNGKITAEVYIYNGYDDALREGALFWVEDTRIGLNEIENPEAVVFGPRLMMLPGNGEVKTVFKASAERISHYTGRKGLRLVLRSESRNSLEIDSPVYYRQVQTGGVEWIRLMPDGSGVETGIFIEDEYRNLVREGTSFTSVSGVDAGFGFFSGFKFKTTSVDAILKGGISFSTKDMTSPEAAEGSVFELSD